MRLLHKQYSKCQVRLGNWSCLHNVRAPKCGQATLCLFPIDQVPICPCMQERLCAKKRKERKKRRGGCGETRTPAGMGKCKSSSITRWGEKRVVGNKLPLEKSHHKSSTSKAASLPSLPPSPSLTSFPSPPNSRLSSNRLHIYIHPLLYICLFALFTTYLRLVGRLEEEHEKRQTLYGFPSSPPFPLRVSKTNKNNTR